MAGKGSKRQSAPDNDNQEHPPVKMAKTEMTAAEELEGTVVGGRTLRVQKTVADKQPDEGTDGGKVATEEAPKKIKTRRARKKDVPTDGEAVAEDDAEGAKESVTGGAGKKHEAKNAANPNAETPSVNLSKLSLPSTFSITSGEILWGQYSTILEGADNTTRDGMAGPKELLSGGTIRQSVYSYRTAARKGTWHVKRIYLNSGTTGSYQAGFICHHESVSATDLVRRAAAIGISNGNNHPDREIVYVNRYDWGCHHRPGAELVSDKLGVDDEEAADLATWHCMLVDARIAPSLEQAMRNARTRELLKDNCVEFAVTGEENVAAGVSLWLQDVEYELAWMCFSGQKHGDFADDDELVGFIYDPAYSALEGDGIQVEDEDV
ncbi:hypothetical protein HK104_006465 [Borealophlyctis nickersoniae]|nr:hypothetical protein HK104_006465 [Borealophlyctis nickersoniae]